MLEHQDPTQHKGDISVPITPRISALDPVEDKEALITWSSFVLPQLPKAIESLSTEEQYTVSLVRQEGNNGISAPVIRFRSPNGQSQHTMQAIQAKIRYMCQRHNRPVIPVKFSRGTITLLDNNHKRDKRESGRDVGQTGAWHI